MKNIINYCIGISLFAFAELLIIVSLILGIIIL